MIYGVYARLDARRQIVEINSDYYLGDTAGYVKIDEGTTERYKEAATQYLSEGVLGFNGRVQTPNYKFINGSVVERTYEEKALDPYSDEPEPPDDYETAYNIVTGVTP